MCGFIVQIYYNCYENLIEKQSIFQKEKVLLNRPQYEI